MIIDIGGGTTDIAVISMGGIVTSASVKLAGDTFDECIVKYIRKKYRLFIGERTAEQLKKEIGAAFYGETPRKTLCKGRDLVSGLPRTVEVTSAESPGSTGRADRRDLRSSSQCLRTHTAGAGCRRGRIGHRHYWRRSTSARS